jgi:CheY-like chemotaxis protein
MMVKSILVVDDRPVNVELLEHLLAGHGYEVETAADATAAIETITRRTPALILMDMQLPGVDGFELTRRLKSDPATAAIPIVAVTSHVISGDRLRAMAAGGDDCVSKPIDARALPSVVARYLAGDATS